MGWPRAVCRRLRREALTISRAARRRSHLNRRYALKLAAVDHARDSQIVHPLFNIAGADRAGAGPTPVGWLLAVILFCALLAIGLLLDPDHMAAFAAVAATLGIAIITWYATDRRLIRELRHQHRRDEIADLREFFDQAALDYEEARNAVLTLAQSQQPGTIDEVRPRFQKMQASGFPVYSAYRRLQVRVEEDEPVVLAFDRLRHQILAAMEPLKAKRLPLAEAEKREVDNRLDEGHQYFREFIAEARAYLKRLAD